MFVSMVNNCSIINMKQISLFYAENVLKMRKMRKSANYADPHRRILSDALYMPVTSGDFLLRLLEVFIYNNFIHKRNKCKKGVSKEEPNPHIKLTCYWKKKEII